MSSGGWNPSGYGNDMNIQRPGDRPLALEQATQQLNNLVRSLNEFIETIKQGVWNEFTIGHNATGATGTAFTATGDQVIMFIQVSSTAGADAVTINWLNFSAGTIHNIITNGVIGDDWPLYIPGPFALEPSDTITYSGADADIDFIITYREKLT